ncbi:condensin complex subunit 3 [Strigomonas culicis]|uniref:Condensin complex subunit 3 n=1 Tax=Strigomonas culicis TaxID=28005 RepID=S9UJK4_9TRYP|nr:condensin complex subunit 3 [Strigomonas culicis]|eukprot:EPY28954.1 condensin complex subunit 3 [Strigomonas culicis]
MRSADSPWRYVVAYALAKSIKLPDLLFQGLTDTNASVVIACRAALTNCWVHRDNKDDCCALLDPIASGYVIPSLAPFHLICDTMLTYVQKRKPETHFQLNLEDVHTSSLLMWRAECKVCSDREDADETLLLPSLEQFCAVLQDIIYAYARPDAESKTVKFRNVEDADNMLRIFLSAFDIYEDNGYLSHVDNTTRNALLRLMNFLLKVVPDDDPALFVDVAVRSIKSLTVRVPEETTRTVTSALDSLFKSLKLPQRFGLGFDDVEALVRKSRERQQDLIRRKALVRSGELEADAYTELKEEMDRDEKFLLRIQLIVLAFLSNSQRGDAIPSFCSHVIQLGRQQDNERVRCAATKSLGLQCLICPDAVHTFVPLLLSDACQPVPAEGGDCAPVAAVGVCFDLIMEYGVKFFDTVLAAGAAGTTPPCVFNAENEFEARLQREQELASEDVHKVGSKTLLATLQTFFTSTNTDIFSMAVAGFCKLLSCNRVPADQAPHIIAKLLVSMVCSHFQKKEDATYAYLLEYLTVFFRSYTSSHPKRQADFAEGGVTAFRLLVLQNVAYGAKVMEWVTHMSDAFTLTLIRDVDPEAASRLHSAVADAEEGEGADRSGAQQRTAAAKASLQSVRLLRELSRYSLHEGLAEHLLAEVALNAAVEVRRLCLDVLERKMYFYAKDNRPFLLYCAQKAAAATDGQEEVGARCAAFTAEIHNHFGVLTAEESMEEKWDGLLQQRQSTLEQLRGEGSFRSCGFHHRRVGQPLQHLPWRGSV